MQPDRAWQAVVALAFRTTTKNFEVMRRLGDTVTRTPAGAARRSLELDFASEEPVVQTGFVASPIALGVHGVAKTLSRWRGGARYALEETLHTTRRRTTSTPSTGLIGASTLPPPSSRAGPITELKPQCAPRTARVSG